MCGIAWIAGAPAATAAIGRMAASIQHRGPDAVATRDLPGCSIGHTRLSIIDLVSGDQPMRDATGRYWIALNGEIYNYRELRAELESAGVALRTTSDTEVALEAWKRWGRDMLHRVRGMFAFAIWDETERTLFASRDLIGEKPLYYAVTPDGALVAASEMKAIVASGLFRPQLSTTAVDAFLSLGYVPPDRTIYSNVSVLPPAHLLEWRDGAVRVERYWRPKFETRAISLPDAASELQRLTRRAVERQMVADVPVGAFLSGGLDSSTIVAMMQQAAKTPVKTFSVAFGDEINELPYARAVARQYGTDHHEIDVGRPNVAELLLRMIDVYDEPFADSSHIPTYMICGYARQFVKVVLSGDGGDELFGGYWWYPPLAASENARFALAQWVVLRLLSRALRGRQAADVARRATAAGFAARWDDMWQRDVAVHTIIRAPMRRRLWGARGAEVVPYAPDGLFRPDDDVTGLNRAFHFDLTSYLPGDILVKVDRAAMAHGLETRAPFLDRDLIEFALSLPPDLKVKDSETKRVMHAAFRELWPKELHGRGKQGFGAPVSQWMQLPPLQELIRRVSRPGSALRDILPGVCERDVQRPDYSGWVLLTLGLWLERHRATTAAGAKTP